MTQLTVDISNDESTLIDLLKNTPLTSFIKNDGKNLISLNCNDNVDHGFEVLVNNGILSAPLRDTKTNKFVGMVDFDDLVGLLVAVFSSTKPENLHELNSLRDIIERRRTFSNVTLNDISDLSLRNTSVPIQITCSLYDVVMELKKGVHRVPVMKGDEVVAIVSQSSIIDFMAKSMTSLPVLRELSVNDFGIGKRELLFVTADTLAIEAFSLMHKHGVSGVPVIDDDGKILTNISLSDLKLLTKSNNYRHLWTTTRHFVCNVRNIEGAKARWPSLECHRTSKLYEVVSKLSATHVHRLYIVDSERKPLSVISLKDILEAVCK